MPIWSFCITDDPDLPDLGRGFVRAATGEEALTLIGDTRANVYPCMDDAQVAEDGRVHRDAGSYGSSQH